MYTEDVNWTDQYNFSHAASPSANLDAIYSYDGEGRVTGVSYPGAGDFYDQNDTFLGTPGPSYTYSFDTLGRLSGMTDQNHNIVVSNVAYGPANELLTIAYNPTSPPNYSYFASYQETRSYNVLKQLTNVTVPGVLNMSYAYPVGANNGKISSQTDALSGETVTYAYDSLNRLIAASGSGWSEQYGYDGFGNLTDKTPTPAGSAPEIHLTVDKATNHITVPSQFYDAHGNQGTGYDGENRLVSPTVQLSYAYDAQNKRMWQWSHTNDTFGNAINYLVNFYGVDGKKLAQYQFTTGPYGAPTVYNFISTLVNSDLYFGSRRLAAMDRLGSAGKYYPYGEDRPGPGAEGWNFGTYWRDSGTGLDYADQRYYSSQFGRFMSPDTGPANLKNPQSFNRYTYAANDPVNFNDPDGRMAKMPDDGFGGFGVTIDLGSGPLFLPYTIGPIVTPFDRAYDRAVATMYGLAGQGLVDDWNFVNGNVNQFALSFNAQAAPLAVGICVAQPELCIAGGVIISIYVTARYLPALIDAIRSQITSRDKAPVKYDAYDAGRDDDGNCKPPDPDKYVKWRGNGDDHWHWITWNQRPTDCMTFPDYESGPDDPGPKYREIPR